MTFAEVAGRPKSADDWNKGHSDIMAVALHRMYGLPLMALYEPEIRDQRFLDRPTRVWVRLPDGRALDATGAHEMSSVIPVSERSTDCRIADLADEADLLRERDVGDYDELIAETGAIGWIRWNLTPQIGHLGLRIDDIWGTLEALDREEDEDADLVVWRRPADPKPTCERPLLIIVHPGDALEACWRGYGKKSKAVREQSVACQEGMASEIWDAILDKCDIVVLHRRSSGQFEADRGARHVSTFMRDALEQVHNRGTVLYAEDLDAAVTWMDENLGIAGRPGIRLMGAYADPDHGCVTAVGKGVEALLEGYGSQAEIILSQHSYAGPGETSLWVPRAASERSTHTPIIGNK